MLFAGRISIPALGGFPEWFDLVDFVMADEDE
jgi:hypothetical protein